MAIRGSYWYFVLAIGVLLYIYLAWSAMWIFEPDMEAVEPIHQGAYENISAIIEDRLRIEQEFINQMAVADLYMNTDKVSRRKKKDNSDRLMNRLHQLYQGSTHLIEGLKDDRSKKDKGQVDIEDPNRRPMGKREQEREREREHEKEWQRWRDRKARIRNKKLLKEKMLDQQSEEAETEVNTVEKLEAGEEIFSRDWEGEPTWGNSKLTDKSRTNLNLPWQ